MRVARILRLVAATALVSTAIAACGSSDSRDRNVGQNQFCAQGGPCQVGEVGPGGGIVVFGTTDPNVDMWEVAPLNGYGTYDDAVIFIEELEFGGKTGWELPPSEAVGRIREALGNFACAPETDCGSEFGDDTYWTADVENGQPVVVSIGDGKTEPAAAGSAHFIRPVRKFRIAVPQVGETTIPATTTTEPPTTTTSTTLPPTTTVEARTCGEGGVCALGDVGPGGGIVFYVADSDFTSTGSDCNTKCRYMEITQTETSPASPWIMSVAACYSEGSNASRANCTWGNSIYPESANPSAARLASEAIGMGMSATTQIYGRMTAGGVDPKAYAAGVAWSYAANGTTDWFLPSKAELNEVFKQRDRIPGITVNTSQSASTYQSSTETTAFYSWAQTMSTGFASNVNKYAAYRVRAVRAFAATSVGAQSLPTSTTTTTTTLPPTTTSTSTTTTTTTPPTTSTTVATVTASDATRQLLATNTSASCAVLVSGSVKCWGRNERGQLGNGESGDDILERKPVQVVGLDGSTRAKTVVQMSGRDGYHVCALTAVRSVVCWGHQYAGQLGDGVGFGGGTPRRPTPVTVTGFDGSSAASSAAYVTAGKDTSCAIKLSGALFCWGDNRFGKAGLGSGDFFNTPSLVSRFDGSTPEKRVINVSLGMSFGCAVTEVGAVHCWGLNRNGQLGDGTTNQSTTPVASSSIDGSTSSKKAVVVSAGHTNACAVMESGAVTCWGLASSGAFGDSKLSGNILTATQVPGIDGSTQSSRAVSLTTSLYHSCASMTDGSVKCWGYSERGQVGVGGTTSSPIIPRGLNAASANKRVKSISSSAYHTCVLQASNDVDCWGGTGALKESSQQNPQEFSKDPDNK